MRYYDDLVGWKHISIANSNSFKFVIASMILLSVQGCAPWVELLDSNVRGTAFDSVAARGYEDIPYIDKNIRSILDKHNNELKTFLSDNGFYCNHNRCAKTLYNHMINHNPIEQPSKIDISVRVTVITNGASGYELLVVHE